MSLSSVLLTAGRIACLRLAATTSFICMWGKSGAKSILLEQVCQPDGEVIITNDGATILNKMSVIQPAAKMLVELAKAQVRTEFISSSQYTNARRALNDFGALSLSGSSC